MCSAAASKVSGEWASRAPVKSAGPPNAAMCFPVMASAAWLWLVSMGDAPDVTILIFGPTRRIACANMLCLIQ